MSLSGHLWTLGKRAARGLRSPSPPPSEPWSTSLEDPHLGPVRITGRSSPASREPLLLLVHGLGGSADSHYVVEMASAAVARGWSVLRLNLRGADRLGEDFYHAGLTADLHAALAAVDGRRRIALVGFSLGGHVALRYATETHDPRVVGVVALCSPLDLSSCASAIDRPGLLIFRVYLLRHLQEIYREVAARGSVPLPVELAARIRRIREWDERVVAPRHGFDGAEDYYRRTSVGPLLGTLRRPVLAVWTRDDPMVPFASVRRVLTTASVDGRLETHLLRRGGHLAFPAALDLGAAGRPGLLSQVLGWLEQTGAWSDAGG